MITSLAKNQRRMLRRTRDRWIKIGLDTSPMDWDRADQAIREVYRCGGLAPPREILHFDDPVQGATAVALAHVVDPRFTETAVWAAVWDAVLWGQHDAAWLAQYDALQRLGVDCSKLRGLWSLARQCGWCWCFRDIAVLTAKPCSLSRDSAGRLHSETRMALQYPSGWGLYRWHGVAVTEDVILHPELITVSQIEAENNAEVRRVLMTRYGESRYLEDTGAQMIQEDEYGKLYRKEVPDDEPLVMVRVLNSTPESDGTHRPYWLRVPPGTETAHQGVAWTFGMTPEQYQPEQET